MYKLLFAFLLACAAKAPPAPPAPPSGATPAPDAFTLHARGLAEDRHINVYKPPGFDAATALPVLYMPDGGLEEDFPHLTATVDTLIRAGTIPPLLVVGIENTERRRDMTGPTEVASDREIAPRVGGSAAFRAFIRDELMPAIGERYRVTADTAIIGESLAGLFIVETFLLEPAMFRRYVALSPSLWWNAEALVKDAPARIAALPAGPRALFLASADEDNIIPGVARLGELLRDVPAATLRATVQPRPDLRHDNIYRSLSATALTAAYSE